MEPLTREYLDQATCAVPDCDTPPGSHEPLYFHGKCHIDSPVQARYIDGVIIIECGECGKFVAEVQIANDSS